MPRRNPTTQQAADLVSDYHSQLTDWEATFLSKIAGARGYSLKQRMLVEEIGRRVSGKREGGKRSRKRGGRRADRCDRGPVDEGPTAHERIAYQRWLRFRASYVPEKTPANSARVV
jgi:hypothetical protein